jgi:mono/diheme cytochrome c family protein
MIFRRTALIACAACLLSATAGTGIAGDRHEEAMAAASKKFDVNIKGVFAGNCSWCHGGKGPKLAGTTLSTEELIHRISNGKSGYMPGFGKVLGAQKVEALAEYIKMLPADE